MPAQPLRPYPQDNNTDQTKQEMFSHRYCHLLKTPYPPSLATADPLHH